MSHTEKGGDEHFIIKRSPLVDEAGRSTRTTRQMAPAPPCGAYFFRTGNFIFHPQTFVLCVYISCNRSVDVGTHSSGRRRAELKVAVRGL
jgi:hypothetical protein